MIVEPGIERNLSANGATEDERRVDQRELEFAFAFEVELLANLVKSS